MMTVVEFTGLTGAGKTTLLAAGMEALTDQGFVARDAYDVILARYGIQVVSHATLRSLLIDLVAFLPFVRYTLTRRGLELLALAGRAISRNAGGVIVTLNLWRNFAKRVGVHVLLTRGERRPPDLDFAICDEGILHMAHNLFVHAGSPPDPAEITHFGNIVPKPDIIIWVKGTADQSIQCILQRGHRRVVASEEAASAFARNGMLTFGLLFSQAPIRERLFTIDNSAHDGPSSIQDRASAIAAFLRQHRTAGEVHA